MRISDWSSDVCSSDLAEERMMSNIDTYEMWPALPFREWDDTAITLQLWTQIVGKVRLSLTPWLNHGWHVPLYVTARGLGTSPIPIGEELLEMEDRKSTRLNSSH